VNPSDPISHADAGHVPPAAAVPNKSGAVTDSTAHEDNRLSVATEVSATGSERADLRPESINDAVIRLAGNSQDGIQSAGAFLAHRNELDYWRRVVSSR